MKIVMFTNTYLPHVGGVARSVKTLEDECRKRGHEVRVVAPESAHAEESPDVLRVPAIQNFNGSDFCVRLPFPNVIRDFVEDFKPDLIHSHHPFLLGDAALREAWKLRVPVVFTHHTLYEQYTHYVPLDSAALKRVAIQLATEYCNLCNEIIAPSESIKKLLTERGVVVPIEDIPTGIDTFVFSSANRNHYREKIGATNNDCVIGHIGRLAHEKNLPFIAEAVQAYLQKNDRCYFLLVGDGSEKEALTSMFEKEIAGGKVVLTGSLGGSDLADAYAAMDIFVFASQSETQGMVLAEAMSAGVPVVALDGPGVREIMINDENGILLNGDATADEFSQAIERLAEDPGLRKRFGENAKTTSLEYDQKATADRVIDLYERLIEQFHHDEEEEDFSPWDRLLNGIEIEWGLAVAKVSAVAAVVATPATEASLD